nr:MAG TPA: hypothetical protein [Caudoviricetes sp.]
MNGLKAIKRCICCIKRNINKFKVHYCRYVHGISERSRNLSG